MNCESYETADYNYCQGRDIFEDIPSTHHKIQEQRYKRLLHILFSIILKSARHLYNTDNNSKKPVIIRIPKLGLGAWAAVLSSYKDKIYNWYTDSVEKLANSLGDNFYVLFVDYRPLNGRTYLYTKDKPRQIFENHADPFGTFDRRSNQLNINFPAGSKYLIINAWDEGSFIGNICAHDNSMDGWTVAGSVFYEGFPFPVECLSHVPPAKFTLLYPNVKWPPKLGSQCENASFLHNAVFQKKDVNII